MISTTKRGIATSPGVPLVGVLHIEGPTPEQASADAAELLNSPDQWLMLGFMIQLIGTWPLGCWADRAGYGSQLSGWFCVPYKWDDIILRMGRDCPDETTLASLLADLQRASVLDILGDGSGMIWAVLRVGTTYTR